MHAGYGNTVYMSLTSLAFKKKPFKMIFLKKCVSVHRDVRYKYPPPTGSQW